MELIDFINKQVEINPENIAVICNGEKLTYRELDKYSASLAAKINKKHQSNNNQPVQGGTFVSLLMERSVEMIVAMIGVLRAGSAYVPIDKSLPKDRVKYILDNTGSDLIICNINDADRINKLLNKYNVIECSLDELSKQDYKNVEGCVNNHLAYVIYTSGTTGTPKGVMINRDVYKNFCQNFHAFLSPERSPISFLSITQYSFDMFCPEYMIPLLTGGTIVLSTVENITDDLLNYGDMIDFIQQTPSMWKMLLDGRYLNDNCMSDITTIVGGEKGTESTFERLIQISKKVIQMYGPTETCVWSTGTEYQPGHSTYIGKPLLGEHCYVLNSDGEQVGMDEVGELFIGGYSISDGYINNPELTHEVFLDDPFVSKKTQSNGRMYKTGDIVKKLKDGGLEYISRNDSQVKIRGFRVELEEIEKHLYKIPEIQSCVVTEYEHLGTKNLIAYAVVSGKQELLLDEVNNYLARTLPDYMLLSSFNTVENIPLNQNGKLDYRALPMPKFSKKEYVAPKTVEECALVELWEELLELEGIGVNDDFFNLGGNSLIASIFIREYHARFNFEISLQEIFSRRTVHEIAKTIDVQEHTVIEKSHLDVYPTVPQQNQILFLDEFDIANGAYNISLLAEIKIPLDFENFEKAIELLIERHIVLDFVFKKSNSGWTQSRKNEAFSLKTKTLNSQSELQQFIDCENKRQFVLDSEVPYRAIHIKVGKVEYLHFCFHHVAFDGRSIDIFIKDLTEIYVSLVEGKSCELPIQDISYGDYACWLNQVDDKELSKSFWQTQFENFKTSELPSDFARPSDFDYCGANINFELTEKLSNQLRELARTNSTTLHTVLLSAFYVMIWRLTDESDVSVGIPSEQRNSYQLQPLVGHFVNSLPLRVAICPTSQLCDFFDQVEKAVVQGKTHQDLSFDEIVKCINPPRDNSKHPLFQNMFSLQTNGMKENKMFSGFDTALASGGAKFDLTVFMDDSSEALVCTFNYATSIFSQAMVEHWCETFRTVLDSFVLSSDVTLSDVAVNSDERRATLLSNCNNVDVLCVADISFVDAFKEAVNTFSDRPAVSLKGTVTTYKDLDSLSDELAQIIADKIGSQDRSSRAAILLDRSTDTLVSILAVMKLGMAYVPINPDYDDSRIDYILKDSSSAILITQNKHLEKVEGSYSLNNVLQLDDIALGSRGNEHIQLAEVKSCSPAYVLYTSGTSGRPKGVVVQHKALLDYANSCNHLAGSNVENVDFSGNYCFDLSITTLLAPLIAGKCVFVYPGDVLDIPSYHKHLVDNDIHFVKTTPSVASVVFSDFDGYLPLLMLGGEKLTDGTLRSISSGVKKIVDEYGPTEAVVGSMFSTVRPPVDVGIGKPYPNVKLYVISGDGQLSPIGAVGELYISGPGLASGYLNLSDETDSRFIVNPFAQPNDIKEGYGRLYKTGDLVRWLADGNMEYLGRRDKQVKIRGFRVELGEIEVVIRNLENVEKVVVTVAGQLNDYLIAYIVLKDGYQHTLAKSISELLINKLPAYMLPARIEIVEDIPLTLNGKVDFEALPKPVRSEAEVCLPESRTEQILSQIWHDLLAIDDTLSISLSDSFFDLGGHSIVAAQMVGRVRNELSVELQLRDIFQFSSLGELANHIDKHSQLGVTKLKRVKHSGDIRRPTSSQKRLWFHDHIEPENKQLYTVPSAFKVSGVVDADLLKISIDWLMRKHESLRSVFFYEGGECCSRVLEFTAKDVLRVQDCSSNSDETFVDQLIFENTETTFDLTNGPLCMWRLIKLSEDTSLVMFNIHHIISDALSIDIITQELSSAYNRLKKGRELPSDTISITMSDYAHWESEYLIGDQFEEQLNFWKEELKDAPQLLNLPIKSARLPKQSYKGAHYISVIESSQLNALQTMSNSQRVTLHMTMLSCFNILLSHYSGDRDICVGVPASSRHFSELENTIGFLTNTLVIRSVVDKASSFDCYLEDIKQKCLSVFSNQNIPFEDIVNELGCERNLSYNPLFQVMFNFHGQDASLLSFEGTSVERSNSDTGVSKFDLTLNLSLQEGNLLCDWEYATDLFDRSMIEQIDASFQKMLSAVIANDSVCIGELDILPDSTLQLIDKWNDTSANYSHLSCIIDQFEESVLTSPTSTALVFEGEEICYSELSDRVNRLAYLLCSEGKVRKSQPVTIMVDRSFEMVVGLLAIMKAGGAYVPVDPEYPLDRIQYILSDCGSELLLTTTEVKERLDLDLGCEKIYLDQINYAELPPLTTAELDKNDLAYVIYTSGSTGNPKGVMINHGNLINRIAWMQEEFAMEPYDSVLQKTPFSFDVSVWEFFWPLTVGARLVLAKPQGHKDPQYLSDVIQSFCISHIHFVPSMLSEFLKFANLGKCRELKTVICSGEELPCSLINDFNDKFSAFSSQAVLHNLYGPTEATVDVTHWPTQRISTYSESRIGWPIANTRMYILNTDGGQQPIGVPGELCIAGDGVGVGYLNKPELTKKAFTELEVNDQVERVYRTGDMACWHNDGTIEYLGRFDSQIKLRGFRIELGEIEAVLSQHDEVTDTVVVLKNKGKKNAYLVAFVVGQASSTDNLIRDLKQYLQHKLPAHMVPTRICALDTLPLTPNGKADRKALLALNIDKPESMRPCLTGTNQALEQQITEVWKKVLDTKIVNLTTNFFDHGGNSLLLVALHHELQELLGLSFPMTKLFEFTTIASQASEFTVKDESNELKKVHNESSDCDDIAIIGLAGRFPGAETPNQLWQNVYQKRSSIAFYSDEELLANGVSKNQLLDPDYVRANGHLNGIEMFDADFFGMSAREAEITDPQRRLLMESAWAAFEDAGYNIDDIGSEVGVYAGTGKSSYLFNNLNRNETVLNQFDSFQLGLANDKDFLTTQISYRLNLSGPSVNVQSACSTSLVAIHHGCRAILANECNYALAGGVHINVPQVCGYKYRPNMISSPDGLCRAFDANAAGTVSGNGVGVVLLKRLDKAIEDRDHIYAVIKGSAINNDGSNKVSFTAPSVKGQAQAIVSAMASVEPETIEYIEAHGTGTTLGDPIEVRALSMAYQERTDKKNYCAISSLKTNVGHLDVAAGVSGLIKASLALKHKIIPASLNFSRPNPEIEFENSQFYVNTENKDWLKKDHPRRAGVSSFGMGGTNAHVVLEEAPEWFSSSCDNTSILTLSAATEGAVDRMSSELAQYLSQSSSAALEDVAYTLNQGRKAFNCRRGIVAKNKLDAIEQLTERTKQVEVSRSPQVAVFMFPGQGCQFVGMGQELYHSNTHFRAEFDQCADIVAMTAGLNIKSLIFSEGNQAQQQIRLNETSITQISLFVVEYCLAKVLIRLGIQPGVMIGHSLGEYVAACISGVFSLEDAIKIVIQRGKLMSEAPDGAMLSLKMGEEELTPLLSDGLTIAAVNADKAIVVSGEEKLIESLMETTIRLGIQSKKLPSNKAFHSASMTVVVEELVKTLNEVTFNEPRIPFVSNLTGKLINGDAATDPDYWCQHAIDTVSFSAGIKSLLESSDPLVFLEVGPGRTLTSFIKQHGHKQVVSLMMQSTDHELEVLYQGVSDAWQQGLKINWTEFYKGQEKRRVPLPTYSFERKKHWVYPNQKEQASRPTTKQITADEVSWNEGTYLNDSNNKDVVRILTDIWRSVLGVEEIMPEDDFFVLGGDSLLGIMVIEQLKSQLGVSINLQDIFDHSTLDAITNCVIEHLTLYASNNELDQEIVLEEGTL
ncbi:amino acid adenylation domain-containing protein [Vibrio sp. Of14-4]|uniref:non-ribosomal peptide synthetase/type I polyketide synthase n=1 Tax=Vibrio sp. Of14-4 TaxID=2724878 RepID=UPI001EF1A22B|nr:non-ribosomal peptide synthetase/type I polyketide synthase [Vibrio sp. Of14-4]MCG7490300.1 amino acid adenylation domain-containing protein [Vibrio sp. Of14-4]